MQLSFYGAVGTVTGSRYLLSHGQHRLLVDCGLFQGVKNLRQRNWRAFPVPPGDIDAVVLTHAHLDHSGYLPRLVREGFRGPIYCTPASRELAEILLRDSGHLQEEDAERANRHGYSKHKPAEPLYTLEEAEASLRQFKAQDFHEAFEVGPFRVRYLHAGHILGAACVLVECAGKRVFFSGDLGRSVDPVMRPPEPPSRCDYLIVESTYGDLRHPAEDTEARIGAIVRETAAKGGTVLLPAFAVGRAQTLLHLLTRLRAAEAIPAVPVYLDSPMAIDVTEVFCRYREEHRLSQAECRALCEGVRYVRTGEESERVSANTHPKVIVAGAGMLTGGRILHHIKAFGSHRSTALVITGFQAEGTRGHALLHGADHLKLYGEYVPINCRLELLEGLSAHADHVEIGDWLSTLDEAPRRVYVTHGEPVAADRMRRYLHERFGWRAEVPEYGDVVELI
ncbi:MAG: MBL fold metallo-hydrolase [Gammaproteobacteria bacterium]|nr:MBL fold metallo-hydrolase [Gammaproteobacteria bacterium]